MTPSAQQQESPSRGRTSSLLVRTLTLTPQDIRLRTLLPNQPPSTFPHTPYIEELPETTPRPMIYSAEIQERISKNRATALARLRANQPQPSPFTTSILKPSPRQAKYRAPLPMKCLMCGTSPPNCHRGTGLCDCCWDLAKEDNNIDF